ncbi:transposase [Corynebacterium sp. TAE3-ERU16]|nr:transposase [Corynebacterium sp. TAE3-ERU16]
MIQGRCAKVPTGWSGARDRQFRDRIKVVTIGGSAGRHTPTATAVPAAAAVMDPFHVVHFASGKLTLRRQRIRHGTCGHRGRTGDLLYGIRRTILAHTGLCTGRRRTRPDTCLDRPRPHPAVAGALPRRPATHRHLHRCSAPGRRNHHGQGAPLDPPGVRPRLLAGAARLG